MKGRLSTPQIVTDEILYGPSDDYEIHLASEVAEGSQVLEFPVLKVVDLTESHGIDFTLGRLEELAKSYNPAIEMASLNFDHLWGGPSFGWCEFLEVRESLLWAKWVDVQAEVLDAIRTKRYTRRSPELTLKHRLTGGWYFTACALLGNLRPAIPDLPPIILMARPVHRPVYQLEEEDMEPETTPASDPPAPASPPPASAQLTELHQAAAQATALVAQLRAQNAELAAEKALNALGKRVTPGVRRFALPILTTLLSAASEPVIKLAAADGNTADIALSAAILDMLGAVPEFEALGAGPLAGEEIGQMASASGLSSERMAELERKFNISKSYGFQN